MANLEKDRVTAMPDVSADCSQKQLEKTRLKDTEGLLIANGALKNFVVENNRLSQGNIALLPVPSRPDPGLTDLKIAECILFSNKLTEKMLGEIKLSGPKPAHGSTFEDLKSVESMNLNNKAADMDAKMEDPGLAEAKPTDAGPLDQTVCPPPEPSVSSNTSSRRRCFCLESREEFGFLVFPDFLILSVSFLFLAYGCSAPVVYLVPYALSVGVGHQQTAFLMSIFGISGIVGNITFGWVADRK